MNLSTQMKGVGHHRKFADAVNGSPKPMVSNCISNRQTCNCQRLTPSPFLLENRSKVLLVHRSAQRRGAKILPDLKPCDMLPARKTPCNPGSFFGKSYPRALGKLDEDSRLIKGSNAEMPNKPFLREFSCGAQAQSNLAC